MLFALGKENKNQLFTIHPKRNGYLINRFSSYSYLKYVSRFQEVVFNDT